MALSFAVLIAAIAAAPGSAPIYYYDMAGLNQLDLNDPAAARQAWDTAHLVTSVQGIVNRDSAALFVRFMPDPDDFWWDYLRREGNWLAGREVITLASVDALLDVFQDKLKGIVVYDEAVPATSNLASMIAGIEDRACLRRDASPDSLYTRVLTSGRVFTKDVKPLFNSDGPLFTGKGQIADTGRTSTGSAKCDAYLWAKHHYLDKNACSREFMAYYIDAWWLQHPTVSGFSNATVTNHDFFIANKAFFFDLHMWEEESPVDDPAQKPGTDVGVLRELLASMYKRADGGIFSIGGFVPWAFKYTDSPGAGGKHGGVDSEWKYAQIISAYNGIMDADALGLSGMANASFYQHHPLKERYPQNPRPTPDALREQGYITGGGDVAPRIFCCFYMGDYDSAAWLNATAPRLWQDPARGQLPCAWAFNPNLDRRAPHVFDYVRSHQSPSDWFIYGDSGAGYLNPGNLIAPRESGFPDGIKVWVKHNKAYAKRYDLSIEGFVIDGHSKAMGEKGLDAYMRFAPDGLVGQKIPNLALHRDTMPCIRMKTDLYGTPQEAGANIAKLAKPGDKPQFMFIRTILQTPSWHKGAMEEAVRINPAITFVDPYSFFLLLKTHVK